MTPKKFIPLKAFCIILGLALLLQVFRSAISGKLRVRGIGLIEAREDVIIFWLAIGFFALIGFCFLLVGVIV